jgi:MinD superfamily P-loop ATPase
MMKQLVVLSGKGGTGKTTIAAALAPLAFRETTIVLADADVDASNLELLLAPSVREENAFISGQIGKINSEICEACGACREVCRFDAIAEPRETGSDGAYRIDTTACEGCAACMCVCPTEAIRMEPVQAGLWFRSDTRFGPLFHAHLFAGRENSGKLVTEVKKRACDLAQEMGASLVLIDGPPGIGCPVISAISGADMTLLVAEPTISGEHDLARVLGVAEHFRVAAAVVINKADLNPARAKAIESFCKDRGVPVIGRVPYDPVVDESIVAGIPLTEFRDGELAQAIQGIWSRMRDLVLGPSELRVVQ